MSGSKSEQPNDTRGTQLPECSFAQENMEGFVLVALDPADHTRIAGHVQVCDACQQVLHATHRVAAVLPYSVELTVAPAAGVRAALLARVAHDSTPPIEELTPDRLATPAPIRPSVTNAPLSAFQSPHVLPASAEPAPASASSGDSERSFWTRWAAPMFIAPLFIALLIVSAWGISQHNQVVDMQRQLALPSVANSSGPGSAMRLYTTRPACPNCTGSGQLGADPSNNKAVLLVWDLNPAEQHEVWCVHDDGESNLVATLRVNSSGQVMQNLEFSQPISGYSEIRIVRHKDSEPELIIAVNHDGEAIDKGSPLSSAVDS